VHTDESIRQQVEKGVFSLVFMSPKSLLQVLLQWREMFRSRIYQDNLLLMEPIALKVESLCMNYTIVDVCHVWCVNCLLKMYTIVTFIIAYKCLNNIRAY